MWAPETRYKGPNAGSALNLSGELGNSSVLHFPHLQSGSNNILPQRVHVKSKCVQKWKGLTTRPDQVNSPILQMRKVEHRAVT